MSELSQSARRRLQKIAQLAARGEGGEKLAAEAMLSKLLRKHGLTAADLDSFITRAWTKFTVEGIYEQNLLEQVIRKVTQFNEFDRYRDPDGPCTCWYELTKAEHEEVTYLFQIMRVNMHAQFERTLAAFVHVNELFAQQGMGVDSQVCDLSEDERVRFEEVSAMARTMSPVSLFRAIK